jgi:diguanylate cyclase (GGDEF)-like protein
LPTLQTASILIAVDPVLAFAFVGWTTALVVAAVAARARRRIGGELARERACARTDAVTGAFNRRALEETLASEQARIDRGAQPAGVYFLDADLFREVNNRYGYAVGDALLVALYERLRSRLRTSDSIYRWGGDEFVVIAPDVHDDASLQWSTERLRRLFADEPLAIEEHLISLTVSIGGALLETGANAFEVVEHAGELAKTAKRSRNTALVQTECSNRGQGDAVARNADNAAWQPTRSLPGVLFRLR